MFSKGLSKCLPIVVMAGFFVLSGYGIQKTLAAPGITTRERVKEELENILSSGEFGGGKRSSGLLKTIADMIKEFIDWILAFLKPIKRGFITAQPPEAGEGMLFMKLAGIIILSAFIFILVFFIARSLRRSRAASIENAEIFEILREPELFEKKAAEHKQKGDFRGCLRFLYIALLLRLNDGGFIRIDKSKTNRQYLRETRASGFGHYAGIAAFTDAFNTHWYGKRSLNADELEKWHRCYMQLAKECMR